MAKAHTGQLSFAAGELSPKMKGRLEVSGYRSAWDLAYNMISDPRGPALRRQNTWHRAVADGAIESRLFHYQESVKEVFLVYIIAGKMFVASETIGYGPQLIQNPDFSGGEASWSTDEGHPQASVTFDIIGQVCMLTPGNQAGRHAAIYQSLFAENPENPHRILVDLTTVATTGADIRVGTSGFNSADVLDQHVDGGAVYIFDFTPGAGNGNLTVTIFQDGPAGGTDTVVNVVAMSEYLGLLPVTELVAPWSDDQLRAIQGVQHPFEPEMWFVHPNVAPQQLKYDVTGPSWTLQPVAFTNPPAEWADTSWPGTMDFFQGRSWFGGMPEHPYHETFWGSTSGDYNDFLIGSADDNALSLTINEDGRIVWIKGAKNLLIGTTRGEYIVTADQRVITPADKDIEQQSAYGSLDIQPIKLGNEVLYVSPDGKKLRSMSYQWTEQGWLSKDITFASEHITETGITDLAFAKDPDDIIWVTLGNGTLVGVSYHKSGDQVIYGWHRHFTDGAIKSITSGSINGVSVPAMAVHRVVNGNDEVHIEIMNVPDLFHGSLHLDDSIEVISVTPTNQVPVPHLEGEEVEAIIDGGLVAGTTVTGGVATFDASGTHFVVGLPSFAYMRTLAMGWVMRDGSQTAMLKKSTGKIYVRVMDSHRMKINGQTPPTRDTETPLGTAQPEATEDIEVISEGWGFDQKVELLQDLPLSMNVLAVFEDTELSV